MTIARRTSDLGGVIPILVTPFLADGTVDHDDLASEVEYLLAAGVSWVGLGYGSEIDRLSDAECAEVTRTVRAALGTRGRLIGNVELTEPEATCSRIERAAAAGADAVLVRPAPAGRPADEAVAAVAARSPVDVVVQDAPQHTGVDLAAETLARLVREVPGVAGVKVEPPAAVSKIGDVAEALAGSPGALIAGRGGIDLVHELERGATGTMPGPAFPDLLRQVVDLMARGDVAGALRRWAAYLPFAVVADRDFDTFLALHKHVLVRRGVIRSTDRRSQRGIDPRLRNEVDRLLDVFAGAVVTPTSTVTSTFTLRRS